MVYKVTSCEGTQTFDDYRGYRVPADIGQDELLVVVEWDGEVDLYIAESDFGVEEIGRMYRMLGHVPYKVIVFKNVTM